MKQLPKIFGTVLVMIAYGIFRDFGWADYAAWTVVISALAIFAGWAISSIKGRFKMDGDSNEKQ